MRTTIITAATFLAIVFCLALLTSCGSTEAPARIVSDVRPVRVRVLESNTVTTVYIPDRELCSFQYLDTIWYNTTQKTVDNVTLNTMMAVIDEQINCNE